LAVLAKTMTAFKNSIFE